MRGGLVFYGGGLSSLPYFNKDSIPSLDIRANNISDLTGIGDLPRAKLLLVASNPISSLSGIGYCYYLTRLDCSKCQLTTLDNLEGCPNLLTINCSDNIITTLEALKCVPKLKYLDCSRNRLENLNGLRHCSSLASLMCSDNHLLSLEGAEQCKCLASLDCRGNPLITLRGIYKVPTSFVCDESELLREEAENYNTNKALGIIRELFMPTIASRLQKFFRYHWYDELFELEDGTKVNRLCLHDLKFNLRN